MIKRITLLCLTILIFFSCTIERNFNYKKYNVLTRPQEINVFYNINLDVSGKSESAFVKKWRDGDYDLTYSYRSDENSEFTPLYYSIDISKRNSLKEAVFEFNSIKSDFENVSIYDSNETIIKHDSIVITGDQNFYASRIWNGQINGVFFVCRKGQIIYSLITSGFIKNDNTFIKKLVEPKISNLNEFELLN